MGNRLVMKMGGAILIALGTLIPMEVKALPFRENPKGFMDYVNSGAYLQSGKFQFKSFSTARFFNPRKCSGRTMPKKVTDGASTFTYTGGKVYECHFDVVMQSSLGSKTCINYKIVYYEIKQPLSRGNWASDELVNNIHFECGPWR